MTIDVATNTDRGIQAAVEAELEWTPDVDPSGIEVSVQDGIVSLAGEVDHYPERRAAERAALRVRDVTSVVVRLAVRPSAEALHAEMDLAKEVEHALRSAADVPHTVKALVEGGDVTLVGRVSWHFQRRAAHRAIEGLRGVHSLEDQITLTPRAPALDTADRIRTALRRNAQVDADAISIVVAGDKVTLSGTVRSWAERRQADLAAWSSPHISEVYNHVVVKS
jgi:osmotically-inducible protein OsmY